VSRWKVVPDVNCYFVTTTIVGWQPEAQECHRPVGRYYWQNRSPKGSELSFATFIRLRLLNHAHYIVSTDYGKNLSDVMRDYGTYTSRHLTKFLESTKRVGILKVFADAAAEDKRGNQYKVWQEGFHPITIENDHFFLEKLNYIHENPVRKGFVDLPSQWRYSSARNYDLDDNSIIAVDKL
jgi:putative transposase